MVLLAIYLILFRGYSVIKFEKSHLGYNGGKKYGACESPLGFDYTHNGSWGVGETLTEAVINAYRNRS